MQKDVLSLLKTVCQTTLGQPLSQYQSHGQVLMDCYYAFFLGHPNTSRDNRKGR